MGIFAALLLGGLSCTAAVSGLEDHTALLQASAHTQPAELHMPAFASQLGALLDRGDVESAVRVTAAKTRKLYSDDTVEDLIAGWGETGKQAESIALVRKEVKALLKLDARRSSAVLQAQPPELESVKEDMRAVLRQLAPDPAQAALLLQQPELSRNITIPPEQLERMSANLARLSASFRGDAALHEQIIARIPSLLGLTQDVRLWEPFVEFEDHAKTAPREVCMKSAFPKLAARGLVALQRMGVVGNSSSAAAAGPRAPPTWPAQPGPDSYVRLASFHGRKWTPAAQAGCGYDLSVGFENAFYLSQILADTPDQFIKFAKMAVNVGVHCVQTSGEGVKGEFRVDLAGKEDADRVTVVPSVDEYAVTLRTTTRSPFVAGNGTGFTEAYSTESHLGGGVRQGLVAPAPMAVFDAGTALFSDVAHTFSYDSADAETAWGGWRFGRKPTLGAEAGDGAGLLRSGAASKAFVSSQDVQAPQPFQGFSDLAITVSAVPQN